MQALFEIIYLRYKTHNKITGFFYQPFLYSQLQTPLNMTISKQPTTGKRTGERGKERERKGGRETEPKKAEREKQKDKEKKIKKD